MSWQDRLQRNIKLTSPSGRQFVAFWRGGPRILNKKIARNDYPDTIGTRVRDLGSDGPEWPLTIYFEGRNNDIAADRFFNTCSERGLWVVVHPTKGKRKLQLITVLEDIQPVTSGNITEIKTDWIEPTPGSEKVPRAFSVAAIRSQAIEVNEAAAGQFTRTLGAVQTPGARTSLISTVGKVIATVKKSFFVIQRTSIIPAEVDAIIRGIGATLADAEGLINGDLLAGQIQRLVQTYLGAQETAAQAFATYETFTTAILAITIDTPLADNLAAAVVRELAAIAAAAAISEGVTVGGVTSRPEALGLVDDLFDYFTTLTAGLDEVQTLYENNPAVFQYFSQSESYAATALLIARAVDFLMSQLFSLAIEKIIVLKTPRAPAEIAVTEYGTLGEKDINLDLLNASNKLKNHELRILPAGKEIVIYA